MHRHIDIYCERLEPGLWAEPLNAVTNAAFFMAATAAYILARKHDGQNASNMTLIILIAAMGLGSALFHTFATLWAMIADIVPILTYQMVFIFLYCHKIISLPKRWSFRILMGFVLTIIAARHLLPQGLLNGSLEYAPALLFVAGLGVYHLKYTYQERFGLLAAAGLFTISIAFRSMDMAVCEAFEIGTHFMWHLCNAGVLYLTARSFILNAKPVHSGHQDEKII